MRIKVRLFGVLREAAGTAEMVREVPRDASAGDVLTGLKGILSDRMLAVSALAVNQEYAARDRQLADGDELAVLPPVSGGAR